MYEEGNLTVDVSESGPAGGLIYHLEHNREDYWRSCIMNRVARVAIGIVMAKCQYCVRQVCATTKTPKMKHSHDEIQEEFGAHTCASLCLNIKHCSTGETGTGTRNN